MSVLLKIVCPPDFPLQALVAGSLILLAGCNLRADPPSFCTRDAFVCWVHPLLINDTDETVEVLALPAFGDKRFLLAPGERVSSCRSGSASTSMSAEPDGMILFEVSASGRDAGNHVSVTCSMENEYDEQFGTPCSDSHVLRVSEGMMLSCEHW